MSTSDIQITEIQEDISLHGLSMISNDRTQASDIKTLSELYSGIIEKPVSEALPFYVVSQNYSEETQQFELFVGGILPHEELQSLTLPQGVYAKTSVSPAFSFLWGQAVGKAKRDFYRSWLPSSDYTACDITYEFHDEKSLAKNGSIDLLFAVKKK